MRLYLVRHGQARSKDEDPARPLSEKGVRDVEKVAAFLEPLGLRVGAVWHSGKTRAAQTAGILKRTVEVTGRVAQHEGLAPNDPIAPVEEELARRREDLMIVGHLPFLGRLTSALVAGDESADVVAFKAAAIECLERDDDGGWRLQWTMAPGLLA